MKRRLLIAIAALLAVIPASADEGMWLLPLLEKMNIKTMQQMGCQLSAEDIYSINHSSIKDAIVHFGGGCTAEMISAEGLLVTNHHCGYGSIQKLSSVEHDYLTNGYWAMNRNEELPAEGLTVTFLESFTDVTKTIEKALSKVAEADRDSVMKAVNASLVSNAVGSDKYLRAYVSSLYGGNAYYLIVEKIYKDVRFVGAPPSSIGKFGADTDNWIWPRHTCDFSMFRVYADKDNNPADYSPDNVPYQPKRHLTVSLAGVQPGDFNMIIGYPGRTNRFMTASELRETRDISNAISIFVRGRRQEILMEDMLADPKVKIQYASKYSSSSNGWKKWIGMNETFGKLNVEQRRADEEKAFTEWVGKKKSRNAKYGDCLQKIDDAVADRAEATRIYRYLAESIGNVEVASAASLAMRMKGEARKSRLESFYKNYSAPTDRKVTKEMIRIYRDSVPSQYHPDFFKTIDEKFGGDIDAYVDDMFEHSAFVSQDKAFRLLGLSEGSDKKEASELAAELMADPAVQYSMGISKLVPGIYGKLGEKEEQFAEGKKEYIAGTLEMRKGAAIYPDANSTMRLTYGIVEPYSPRDAVQYNYYTTLKGVMEKEDPNNWEFVVPEKLKELYAAKDFGRYADANGEMHACFINNGDITGGNSGSPVLNAKGELIGLAFDGNWEAMSGDIIFEPELQRCINVDIRYVLFIMDKFGGAGYLLDEMTIAE